MRFLVKFVMVGCVCGSAFSMMAPSQNSSESEYVYSKLNSDSGSMVKQTISKRSVVTAETLLTKCKNQLQSENVSGAVTLFKQALIAEGDQACFFFGDIVRLLINQGKINFKMSELYTDYGITDMAKEALLSLSDEDIRIVLSEYTKMYIGKQY